VSEYGVVPWLDPAVCAAAKLTRRQAEVLSLYGAPGTGPGYRSVALALGVSWGTVHDHVKSAMSKIERAMREEPVPKPRTRSKRPQLVSVATPAEDDPLVGPNPFA
jgi:DNA-binding NarL/FixJ family response regulator